MEERITVETGEYNKVLLKHSYNWPQQYAMEEPEKGGRQRELALLRLSPLGQ